MTSPSARLPYTKVTRALGSWCSKVATKLMMGVMPLPPATNSTWRAAPATPGSSTKLPEGPSTSSGMPSWAVWLSRLLTRPSGTRLMVMCGASLPGPAAGAARE